MSGRGAFVARRSAELFRSSRYVTAGFCRAGRREAALQAVPVAEGGGVRIVVAGSTGHVEQLGVVRLGPALGASRGCGPVRMTAGLVVEALAVAYAERGTVPAGSGPGVRR